MPAQSGRTIWPGSGSVVLCEHAAHDVFVDLDAKGTRDLLLKAADEAGLLGPAARTKHVFALQHVVG